MITIKSDDFVEIFIGNGDAVSGEMYRNTNVPTYDNITSASFEDSVLSESEYIALYNGGEEKDYNEYLQVLQENGYYRIFTDNFNDRQTDIFIALDENDIYKTIQTVLLREDKQTIVNLITEEFDITSVVKDDDIEIMVKTLNENLSELKELRSNFKKAISDYKGQLKTVKQKVSNIESAIDDIEKALKSAENRRENILNERNVRVFLNGSWTWTIDYNALEYINSVIDSYESDLNSYTGILNEWSSAEAKLEKNIRELESLVSSVDKQIIKVENLLNRVQN